MAGDIKDFFDQNPMQYRQALKDRFLELLLLVEVDVRKLKETWRDLEQATKQWLLRQPPSSDN